jgi:hypothetical protein
VVFESAGNEGSDSTRLFDLLPSPSTLQQGAKSVASQFKYSYVTGERDHMLYFATFNNSFATGGVTTLDRSLFLDGLRDRFRIFAPGELRPANCRQVPAAAP